MIALTIRPKILSVKNRWRHGFNLRSQIGRDFILASFSIAVMASIYYGLYFSLLELEKNRNFVYFHPSLILGVVFLFLLGLLMFSNSVSALGALFLAQDLDLILASPLNRFRFFCGKLLEVIGSSTWMVMVFGFPAIVAFVNYFGVNGWIYYPYALFILIPYFVIPSAISIVLLTLFTSVVPANRTRELLFVVGGLGIVGLYFAIKLFFPGDAEHPTSINDLLYIVNLLQLPHTYWSPSFWVSTALGEVLEPTGKDIIPHIAMLYGVALSLSSAAYITLSKLHTRAYSMARSGRQGMRLNSRRRQRWLVRFTPFLNPAYRAVLGKEISVFLRDMTQTVQLMLLLGLCTIYLYNLKVLRIVHELPPDTRVWWQAFLVIGNMAMGAFVIAAVCTRFVFPSVSLEGKGYWALRSSPVAIGTILRAKFWTWFFPVASIGSVLLTSGAFAIQADGHVVIVSGLISWILCYGIVGLGIGLGAVYANFDWEHSSQLAASFGSLIFMISSTVFIAINLIPTTVIILMRSLRSLEHDIGPVEWYISITSCAALLTYLNYAIAHWALKIGENSLLEREK